MDSRYRTGSSSSLQSVDFTPPATAARAAQYPFTYHSNSSAHSMPPARSSYAEAALLSSQLESQENEDEEDQDGEDGDEYAERVNAGQAESAVLYNDDLSPAAKLRQWEDYQRASAGGIAAAAAGSTRAAVAASSGVPNSANWLRSSDSSLSAASSTSAPLPSGANPFAIKLEPAVSLLSKVPFSLIQAKVKAEERKKQAEKRGRSGSGSGGGGGGSGGSTGGVQSTLVRNPGSGTKAPNSGSAAAAAANASGRKQPRNGEHKDNGEGGPSKKRRAVDKPVAGTQRSVMQRFQQNQQEIEHHQTRLRSQRIAGLAAMQEGGMALNGSEGAALWALSPPFPTSASSEGPRDNGLTPPQHGPTPPSSMPVSSTSAAVMGMTLEQGGSHSVFPPDVHMHFPNDGQPQLGSVTAAAPPAPPSYPSGGVAAPVVTPSHPSLSFQQQSAPPLPSHSSSAFQHQGPYAPAAGAPPPSYLPPTPYPAASASSTIPYSMHGGALVSPAPRGSSSLMSAAGAGAGEIVSSVRTEASVMNGAYASRMATGAMPSGVLSNAPASTTNGRPVMSAAAAIAAANPQSVAPQQQWQQPQQQRSQAVLPPARIPVPNWQHPKQSTPQQQTSMKQEFNGNSKPTVQQQHPVPVKQEFPAATASKPPTTTPQPVFSVPPRPSMSFAPPIPPQQPRSQIPSASTAVAQQPQPRAAQVSQVPQQHRPAVTTGQPSIHQHPQRPPQMSTPSFVTQPQPQPQQQQRPVAPPAAPASSSSYLPITQAPSPIAAPLAAAPTAPAAAAAPSKFFDDDDDWGDDALQMLEQVEKQHLSLSQPVPPAIQAAQTASAEALPAPMQLQAKPSNQQQPTDTMSIDCVAGPQLSLSTNAIPQPVFAAVAQQPQRTAISQQQPQQGLPPPVANFRSPVKEPPHQQLQQVRQPQQLSSTTVQGKLTPRPAWRPPQPAAVTSSHAPKPPHPQFNATSSVRPSGGMHVASVAPHAATEPMPTAAGNSWKAPPVQQLKQPQQQVRPVVPLSPHPQPQRLLPVATVLQTKPMAVPPPPTSTVVPPPAQNIWISSQWA